MLLFILSAFAFITVNSTPIIHDAENTLKSILSSSDPWEEFRYAVDLDVAGKYWLFWTPDDETKTITFEVHVEAHGYVGFGLSPNGGMPDSDVIIGWVSDTDGQVFFHDRHAEAEAEPLIDESQDWNLLSAHQNDTHTILRFDRPYITCDEDDRDITDDTTRVIFSFTDTDPEDITGLDYHGSTNRGTKSVILINYNEDGQSLPDDAVYMDILITENVVPRKRTTYWCEIVKMQQKEEKHHVIMYEPVIKPGNEGLVHHIVIYACYGDMDDEEHGFAWDCIDDIMPVQKQCTSAWFVWAVGGNGFYFPEHTGIPFFTGDDTSPSFMRIEMHYDNPAHVEGRADNSGIRLWMTPTIRQYDTGLLIVGSSVSESMMIPPEFDTLHYRGHCTTNCINQAVGGDKPEHNQMNAFAVYQHAHLLGTSLRTRLFRDGEELEPLLSDESYDFNFQETRMLKTERAIIQDDLFVVDCIYDSSHKMKVTKGGFATKNEMCVSFIYYYPALGLTTCLTEVPRHHSLNIIDDIQLTRTETSPFFRITAPPKYENKTALEVFEMMDWTNETLRSSYQELLLEEGADMIDVCVFGPDGMKTLTTSPELGESWVDPDEGQC